MPIARALTIHFLAASGATWKASATFVIAPGDLHAVHAALTTREAFDFIHPLLVALIAHRVAAVRVEGLPCRGQMSGRRLAESSA